MCSALFGALIGDHSLELKGLPVLTFLTVPALCVPAGDGNEAIGALIQNYIREIEELR